MLHCSQTVLCLGTRSSNSKAFKAVYSLSCACVPNSVSAVDAQQRPAGREIQALNIIEVEQCWTLARSTENFTMLSNAIVAVILCRNLNYAHVTERPLNEN